MKKNRKGFTLIELLAVIVVIALLMILAMPAILNVTENARKSTFQNTIRKLMSTAESMYQSDALIGTGATCYKAESILPNSGYKGYILLDNDATPGQATYAVVWDGNYQTYYSATGAATAPACGNATKPCASKASVYNKKFCVSTGTTYVCDIAAEQTAGALPVKIFTGTAITIPSGCQ